MSDGLLWVVVFLDVLALIGCVYIFFELRKDRNDLEAAQDMFNKEMMKVLK